MRAAREFETYIEAWFEQRRHEPGDDLLTAIVRARLGKRPLGAKDKVHEALLLLVGGDETTRHVITGGLVALMAAPQQMNALRADISRIPRAVEEMLRWVTPV